VRKARSLWLILLYILAQDNMERELEKKKWSEQLHQAHEDFKLWLSGKLDKPPKNPFLPPEVEEGGLVEPYAEGKGTELEAFPQAGEIYHAPFEDSLEE